MMLLVKLESIEHARFRALAQIYIDKDAGRKAFEEYMEIAFPYMKATKERDLNQFLEIMKQELARGPLVATPQAEVMVRSKLRAVKVVSKPQKGKQEQQNSMNRLYSKLGQAIPLR